jgi:hypothetical protein
MHRLRGLVIVCALASSTVLGSAALAQTPLDTPSASLTTAEPSGLLMQLQAGASGAPSGFYVEWMTKADYDALGGWPTANQAAPASYAFSIFWGTPTFVLTQGEPDFSLGANAAVNIGVGKLFDETGIATDDAGELVDSQQYVFHVMARGWGTSPASDFSPTFLTGTTASNNCTYTQGYWKNHSSAWPVSTLKLGNVTYTKAQLLSIFGQPAQGNGLTILAHQLIAAKLNIAYGASSALVASTIAPSDAAIGNLVCPPIGSGYLSPGSTNAWSTTLDNYNNGQLGPGHCDTTTPVHGVSWGRLKVNYR